MVERMASRPVREHSRDQQHHDQSRQQPGRSDDQLFRQRHINPSDRKEREDHLPAWLRLIDPTHTTATSRGFRLKLPAPPSDRNQIIPYRSISTTWNTFPS